MTPNTPLPSCSILLLAGGRGQRMGGQDKGLVQWQGEPLIAHLHRQTRAMSDDLIISCNRNPQHYAMYADQLVHDEEGDFPGPLAGIRAGLKAAKHPYLLVLPCDVPQIDANLLDNMRRMASQHPDKTADGAPRRALGAAAVCHPIGPGSELRTSLARRRTQPRSYHARTARRCLAMPSRRSPPGKSEHTGVTGPAQRRVRLTLARNLRAMYTSEGQ